MIPQKDPFYVPTPYFSDLRTILSSNIFYPVLITGPSGVGKTFSIDQACEAEQRALYRVNITVESDEDSLMGGFRLKDGETVFHKGPVVEAMETGSVLLLDEIDLGSPTRIMCLQSVLEGKGYYLKRINEWVKPQKGFTVFATANTKGQGDESAKYVGTQILNEAALDRFPITIEAGFPTRVEETKMLQIASREFGLPHNNDMINLLIEWANQIRETVATTPDIVYNISTRRLVDILKTYKMFHNFDRSVALCIGRFDEHHQAAYMKILQTLRPEDKTFQGDVDYNDVSDF
jgi:midasin (ATPase involved in ribosome maturation)